MEQAEGDPSQGQSCFDKTSQGFGSLTWNELNDCATNMADKVQTAAMDATPDHDYVPWCLIDGVQLEHTNLLKSKICDAYTGPRPASCGRLSTEMEDRNPKGERKPSMNNWY
jgi:hypothetical protein